MADQVIAKLPNHNFRLFGLARDGGLRTHFENHALTWEGVNLVKRRMTVYAKKTGVARVLPIIPRLADLFAVAKRFRVGNEPRVLPMTTNNLHRTVRDAIKAAGLPEWDDLFQALRRAAGTDFASKNAPHAAAAWLGHGVAVSAKHYLQVPDYMLDQAAGLTGRVDPSRQQRPRRKRRHPSKQAA